MFGPFDEAKAIKFEAKTFDLVLDYNNTPAGSSYVVPVPVGANRVEIVARINGTSGDIHVLRNINKHNSPSTQYISALMAALPYNSEGMYFVGQIAPATGTLTIDLQRISAGGTANVTVAFWRED